MFLQRFTLFLRSFVLLREVVNSEYDVEPPAAEEGLPFCEGVLPLVIHTQAWSSPREEGLRSKSVRCDEPRLISLVSRASVFVICCCCLSLHDQFKLTVCLRFFVLCSPKP